MTPHLTSVLIVELALDRYVAERRRRGTEPYGCRAVTLAHLVGISRREMSGHLQSYRRSQRTSTPTRYTLGCEGYGEQAYWHILGKPGNDLQVVRENRKAHMGYVARDLTRRALTDIGCEVNPGLRGAPDDHLLEALGRFVEKDLVALTEFVQETIGKNGA